AQREIGPHGVVPFYNPGQSGEDAAQSLEQLAERCGPQVGMMQPDADADEARRAVCDLPLGGFTLWEAGLELRVPIAGALSAAVFSDASDVSGRRFDFRFNRPHLSAGLGIRYDTPVGPVRLDGGYRIPGLQVFGDDDTSDEGLPQELFGLPVSVSFGIGESF
ncbi:MAG TPA: BamA/TamA family outer membrane protein, partial [Polyangiaceae bacterium]|nr:BamA/TamA family outer membrane protein [Polyangiaceae bacterium]